MKIIQPQFEVTFLSELIRSGPSTVAKVNENNRDFVDTWKKEREASSSQSAFSIAMQNLLSEKVIRETSDNKYEITDLAEAFFIELLEELEAEDIIVIDTVNNKCQISTAPDMKHKVFLSHWKIDEAAEEIGYKRSAL